MPVDAPALLLRVVAAVLGLAAFACASGRSGAPPETVDPDRWRAVLESPGGELPFVLIWDGGDRATIENGEELLGVDVGVEGDRITFDFPHYDSRIVAAREGEALRGEWTRTAGVNGKLTRMPFRAGRTGAPRFDDVAAPAADFGGRWRVAFDSDAQPAIGLFEQHADGRVAGTFRTATGDYRFLAGRVTGSTLSLSVFDGAHAFLFRAEASPDGTLAGDFWSRDVWHERWNAARDDAIELPDGFERTRWVGDVDWGSLAYPDLEGTLRRLDDPAFAGPVRLLEVYGTWCPNCNDAAVFLQSLHERYAGRGLSILGLAFEMTGDLERDARQVRRYEERYGIEFPSLIAGTSDKTLASEAFPLVDRVRSYPTFVFFDADGRARYVYSGFDGPATGARHEELKAAFVDRIESLLREAGA